MTTEIKRRVRFFYSIMKKDHQNLMVSQLDVNETKDDYKDSDSERKKSKGRKWVRILRWHWQNLLTEWNKQGRGRTLTTNKDATWMPSQEQVHKRREGWGSLHHTTKLPQRSDATESPNPIPSFSAFTFLNLPVAVYILDIFLNLEIVWFVALCSPSGESNWYGQWKSVSYKRKRFPSKDKWIKKKHQR